MAGQIDPDVFRAIYGRDPAPTGVVANPLPALQHVAPEAAAKGLQHQRRTGIDAILAAEHLPQVEQERDQAYWDVLVQRAEHAVAAVRRCDVYALNPPEPAAPPVAPFRGDHRLSDHVAVPLGEVVGASRRVAQRRAYSR